MKKYNTTNLNPQAAFERHVFHRDQFAHYLRWTHILKQSKINEITIDFGCGNGNLLEVLYRNKFKQKSYIGLDIRQQTINNAKEKFKNVSWASFICEDLVYNINNTDFQSFNANKVCSFEVIEHIGKKNIDMFLTNFIACGNQDAIYYISTPCYDSNVGAASNHTFDSGDERGVAVQEFEFNELHGILNKYFIVLDKFGTFASIKDYKPYMNVWQYEMFNKLSKYYDSNLVSNLMAPFFPEYSRNVLWILKRKSNEKCILF